MTRRPVAALVPLALLALALLVLAGCAPRTDQVHHVADSAVPFGLMSPSETGTASAPTRGPTTPIYFLRGTRLTPVNHRVVGANLPAEATRDLLAGPSADETARGLTSAVPANTHLLSLDVAAGIATVDLSTEFGALGGDKQTQAVAQIVYTITASRYVDGVRFAINGEPIEVPDGTGSLSATPRRRGDYIALAPR